MTIIDTVSFTASIASLVLAIGAIWLSIVFYKMSVAASNATTEAAKGIAASVERLENLFDKLYSDTFSMMRDTVSDMRKHMWPTDEAEPDKAIEEAEKKADDKIGELKKDFEHQISEMLVRQKIAEDKVSNMRSEMGSMIDRVIMSSRQAESEAREETMREHILRYLRVMRRRKTVTLAELVSRTGFSPHRVFIELERLKAEGVIDITPDKMEPHAEIRLLRVSELREGG